mgnify:CR=1 FL=1
MRICRYAALACTVALACAGYVALDRWQRQLIFSVEMGERSWWREPPAGTEIYDLPVPGGGAIRTWYWRHPDPAAPTILYLHGSRWNLNGSAFRIDHWTNLGYSIVAIDYRGFGASSPRLPSQASVRQDARTALEELARRQPDPSRRFVYGHSLGGAIAIDLLARTDAPEVAGLIAEATFTRIRDMIATTRWRDVPGMALLVTQPFDSLDAIASLRIPILLIHGTNDQVVPHTMSDELWSAARSARFKRLVKIEGASHSGASRTGPLYDDAVRAFVQSASAAYAGAEAEQNG